MPKSSKCWCGNIDLQDYSPHYSRCFDCNTLVLREWPYDNPTQVEDSGELYSKDYYLKHLPESYGFPSLMERARLDLVDRIPYWLRTLLKYRLPPASVLELGSAHGGFVAFLNWAGYQVTGLELSPWLVEFAQESFGVQVLQGALEAQNIPETSLDVIAHMDVLEHLPDPVETMRIALSLLQPDGIMLLQTPCFDPSKSYKELVETDHPFLTHFKELEHLYLFSMQALEKFFCDLGYPYLQFEPAIFSDYDMFAIVSREPVTPVPVDEQAPALEALPSGRLVQALLDLYNRADDLQRHADERLRIIREQSAEIELLRTIAQERLDLIDQLSGSSEKQDSKI